MKLLKQLSIYIALTALCFLCAPSLSFAQSPNNDPTDERPKPPAHMSSGRLAGDTGFDNPIGVNATLDYIEYDLSEVAFVEIWLYDERGTMRQALRNDWQSAGDYGLTINHDALPAGVYFYDVIINGVLFTRRFTKD